MIKYIVGNIFESNAEALVNTVNTDGVMGKGIALQFKKLFPYNFKAYTIACANQTIGIGKLLVLEDSSLITSAKTIINFPTKTSWRKPSEYDFIEKGLDDLVRIIEDNNIESIAIPPLGAGNGGLKWEKVKTLIDEKLANLKTDVFVYEPTEKIKEALRKERIKLTDARALLLYVLYQLIAEGEYVSEFSSEKVCYFLQRLGAKKYFKLQFEPNFYGPYSGKVRFVLNVLNGSYISGYSDMNKKPFEPLMLVADGYEDVKNYIKLNPELNEIANRTSLFLTGYYSDFALELLSSVDYIAVKNKTFDIALICEKLESWSDRKRSLFSNQKHINLSIEKIQNTVFYE